MSKSWGVCDYTGNPCLNPEQSCRCDKCQNAAKELMLTVRGAPSPAPEPELLDEAVTKWIDGPETIEDFCEWLIKRAREAGAPSPAVSPNELQRQMAALVVLLRARCSDTEWAEMCAKFEILIQPAVSPQCDESAGDVIEPHSSQIYTDLTVRCHGCGGALIWRYLEDKDEIEVFHDCVTAKGHLNSDESPAVSQPPQEDMTEPCETCGKPDGINHAYDCPEAQE